MPDLNLGFNPQCVAEALDATQSTAGGPDYRGWGYEAAEEEECGLPPCDTCGGLGSVEALQDSQWYEAAEEAAKRCGWSTEHGEDCDLHAAQSRREPKILKNWADLEEFGFFFLTGESCGYGQRVLLDLTEEAVKIVEQFFSITMVAGNNWNTNEGEVASIMLTHSSFLELAAFCLLQEMYEVALIVESAATTGFSAFFVKGLSLDQWQEMQKTVGALYEKWRVYFSFTGAEELRNRHGWTGRLR